MSTLIRGRSAIIEDSEALEVAEACGLRQDTESVLCFPSKLRVSSGDLRQRRHGLNLSAHHAL